MITDFSWWDQKYGIGLPCLIILMFGLLNELKYSQTCAESLYFVARLGSLNINIKILTPLLAALSISLSNLEGPFYKFWGLYNKRYGVIHQPVIHILLFAF